MAPESNGGNGSGCQRRHDRQEQQEEAAAMLEHANLQR
jgi:hypothetical protein